MSLRNLLKHKSTRDVVLTWEEVNLPYVIPKYFMPASLRTSAVNLAPLDPKSFMWLLASVTASNPANLTSKTS